MTEKKDVVEQVIERAKPILANITFGGIMGYCSGVAAQKIGKAMAVVIGTGFVGLQLAATFGYIDVKWDKVVESAKSTMDVTEDGQLNADDAKEWWKRLKTLLTYKLPSAGGFSVGFLYGVRYG